MGSIGSSVGVGIAAFAATNIDDLFILSAFFADARLARRSVVAGQFVGIGALVLASLAAALLAVAIPAGWVSLLGLVPVLMGASGLLALWRGNPDRGSDSERHRIQDTEHRVERRLHSQVLAVVAVTIANGGDNLGVYVPLFATAPSAVPVYVSVFAAMTAIWCVLGYLLVNNPLVGAGLRRHGHVALPLVLIALGAYILSGAAVLFR